VRFSFPGVAASLPAGLARQAMPVAELIDATLYSRDDVAVSRRITLIAFIVRILSAAIAYVSQILLARWMGDFEYGIFAVVWVGAIVLGGLACFGFQTALIRLVPEYVERSDEPALRGILLGSRIQGLVASTLFAGIGALGLYFFSDSFENYYLVPLYLGAVTLPMFAMGEIHDGVSRAFNWADIGLWPTFVVRPLLILGFMGAAIASGAEANAVTAMGSVIAAAYSTVLLQFVLLRRRLRTVVPAGPRDYRPRSWVAVALPIFVVEGFFNLLTNIDIIIVGHFMQPDQVAIYFAAAKTLALVHFVYFAVRAGATQRFAQYYAAGDRARLEAFVRTTLHWTFWPSLAMILVMFVVGEHLLALFGPNFTAGYPLFYILAIGLVCRAAVGPASMLLIMAGQQSACAVVYTVTFAMNVALNVTLIPELGLKGAATATTVALVFEAMALYWIGVKRLGIHCSIISALRSPRPAPVEALQ
jgi:O-antigen/teichoic acid export membrane protein